MDFTSYLMLQEMKRKGGYFLVVNEVKKTEEKSKV